MFYVLNAMLDKGLLDIASMGYNEKSLPEGEETAKEEGVDTGGLGTGDRCQSFHSSALGEKRWQAHSYCCQRAYPAFPRSQER